MNGEWTTVEVLCPLCGTADKKLLGTFHFQGQPLGLVECEECSLVYFSPHLSDEAMEAYFQTYTDVSSPEKIARWRACNQPKIEQDLNILKSLLPRGGRILDIGCGYGFFLQQARAIGYESLGVEVSRPACEYASKELSLDVRQGYLKEMGFKPETFDAVFLFDVLYHLSNPLDELLQIERILRRGGILLVRVLNRISYARLWQAVVSRMNRNDVHSFDTNPFLVENHLTHFDRYTLELILTRAGFKPIIAFNTPLTNYPERSPIIKASRCLFGLGLNVIWFLSGRRLCLAPSVTVAALKP